MIRLKSMGREGSYMQNVDDACTNGEIIIVKKEWGIRDKRV